MVVRTENALEEPEPGPLKGRAGLLAETEAFEPSIQRALSAAWPAALMAPSMRKCVAAAGRS